MNRRELGLVSLATLLGLGVLAWRLCLMGKAQAEWVESHLGYYIVGAALLWFVWEAGRVVRASWSEPMIRLRRHVFGMAVILGGALFFHLHEPHVFKVLFDEPSHMAGSLMMHTERMAVMPARVHLLYGGLVNMGVFPSMRMYLFQVLLCCFHDVLGYSSQNVFWLNALLGLALLAQVYLIGVRLVGRRGGILGVLLLSGLPLLAQNVTSGGYDVLNLALLPTLVLATWRYLSGKGTEGLNLMVATAVLLALSRYESVVYLLVPVVAATLKWWRERRITLTTLAALSPLLVVPNLVANYIMVHSDTFMLVALRKKLGVDFFNPNYLPGHAQDLLAYLFTFDSNNTNSLLLSAVGVVGLVGMLVSLARRALTPGLAVKDGERAILMVTLTVLGLLALALSNFWGTPLDPLASRFTLPFHLVMVIGVVWLLGDIFRDRPIPGWFLGTVGAAILVFTIPANAKHSSTNSMISGTSNRWFLDYAKTRCGERVLYAANSALPILIERIPSVQICHLNAAPLKALRAIQAHFYDEIVVHEIWVQPFGGEAPEFDPITQLDPCFVVEVVAEARFIPDSLSRIVRIKGVRQADGTIVTPETLPPLQEKFADQAEQVRYFVGLLP